MDIEYNECLDKETVASMLSNKKDGEEQIIIKALFVGMTISVAKDGDCFFLVIEGEEKRKTLHSTLEEAFAYVRKHIDKKRLIQNENFQSYPVRVQAELMAIAAEYGTIKMS